MDYEELTNLLFRSLTHLLENKKSLFIFASERAHFEGWLKVEICDILFEFCDKIVPEQNTIDVTFNNWLLELKTISTAYVYDFVRDKGSRRITEKRKSVTADINKLKKQKSSFNKGIIFIVFPADHNNPQWQYHLAKINKNLKKLRFKEFKFKDKIPGVIYSGYIE